MRTWRISAALVLSLLAPGALTAADAPAQRSPKEALQAFNDLIGSWRAAGEPHGTREEKQRGFWQEKISWEWQFKGKDAWLRTFVENGKYFTSGELRYLPAQNVYQLRLQTPAKETQTFEGPLKQRQLILERTDDQHKRTQRLTLSLLHANRYLLRYEVKPAEHTVFTPVYLVGATKEGVAFASDDDGQPECVVSGGLGKFAVSYKGKTYYVCCSGCRDAFKEEPEKYIKEYEAKQKAKGK
jgi:YHS domain-containing protein